MGDWDLDSPAPSGTSRTQPPVSDRGGSEAPRTGVPKPAGAPAAQPGGSASTSGPVAPPRKRRLSYGWTALAVFVLIVGLVAGFFIGRAQYSDDSAALAKTDEQMQLLQAALTRSEDRNWTYRRAVEDLKTQLAQATASTSTTIAPSPATPKTYTDGMYRVGTDIQPGTYKGAVTGTLGYWARLKSTDGSISAIIENGIPKGPFLLTIATADLAVELRGVTLTPQ